MTCLDLIILGNFVVEDGNGSLKCFSQIIPSKHLVSLHFSWRERGGHRRDITLLMKICLVKAMVFPVVMYRFESWTIKKAECQRTDALELWC